MSSPMMKSIFGFCCCAVAGVLAGPNTDSDINVVAPSSAARGRLFQPVATLRSTFEMPEFFCTINHGLTLLFTGLQASQTLRLTHGKQVACENDLPSDVMSLCTRLVGTVAWSARRDHWPLGQYKLPRQ